MLNTEAKLEFDALTAIDPKELTKDQIAIIRARRSYLRPEQVQAFASILKGASPMSKEDQQVFNKENQKAVNKAKKEAEAKAKDEKTTQEAQNPGGK